MNSCQPEDKKAFDSEARSLATNAEKLLKEWLVIHTRMSRRTLKNEEALEMSSKAMKECRCISLVATAVAKTTFNDTVLEEHLEQFADFGDGVKFRLWKQKVLELARLDKDLEMVKVFKNKTVALSRLTSHAAW